MNKLDELAIRAIARNVLTRYIGQNTHRTGEQLRAEIRREVEAARSRGEIGGDDGPVEVAVDPENPNRITFTVPADSLVVVKHTSRIEAPAPWFAMRDALVRRYGEEIGTFLAKRIGSAIRSTGPDPCIDGFRVADTAIDSEVDEYERIKSAGCCGFYDDRITHYKSGRTFRFGFNFGH